MGKNITITDKGQELYPKTNKDNVFVRKNVPLAEELNTIDARLQDVENGGTLNGGIINQNGGGVVRLWYGTLAEYNDLVVKEENTIYLYE